MAATGAKYPARDDIRHIGISSLPASRFGSWPSCHPHDVVADLLPIGDSWIFFLKKLPITIKIRPSQSRRLTASEGQVQTQV
jgi:hypothetical protein